jgi:ubiquinone/menaquinone biosynthesis C-methylase UbiE
VTDPKTDSATSAAGPGREHYSYTHWGKPEVAARFDQKRFGHPIGQHAAATQEALLLDALAPLEGRHVLDVATGTGRAALALAKGGAVVTGVDASAEMLAIARARAEQAGLSIRFQSGDAHELPFADRSFDAAVTWRLLMHTPHWRKCIDELCRVTRQRVVLDYPKLGSFALLHITARRLRKHAVPYRLFSERSIRNALRANGFRIVQTHRQFVLPFGFYKKVGSLKVALPVERGLRMLGLLRLMGTPVTVVAER